jgi:glycosyltransferase involved in cell wall biosynthesis
LKAPFFLYVSRLEHPAKNHVRLIAAFEQFKRETQSPWLLALAGSDWHGAEAIHAAAGQSPFREDIRFLGFVEDAALPGVYRAAGAFVYPSLFEGFGLPPVEAMACGCPVMSSTRGSLEEVVGSAAIQINPDDLGSMAAGLRQLAGSQADRERLRLAGFQNAHRFHWEANAAAVVGVWERAVSGGNKLGSFSPGS